VWSAVGYAPYGEAFSLTGGDRNFTGMDQDIVGGVYDFPMREYSPAQGRWWTPDPAGLAGVDPNNPQSWNRYAYVNGSPLNSTDPLGLEQVEVGRCSWDETSFYVDGEYQGTVWTFEGCKEPIPTDLGGDSGGGGGGGGQGPAGSSTGGAQASAGSFACGLSVPWGTFQTDSRAVPLFQQSLADALTYAFAAANARGIVPQIDSGFLTPEDQQRMLSGGSGPNPAARISWHEAGLAVDLNTQTPGFGFLRETLQQEGLAWGGNFRNIDRPHFQEAQPSTSPAASLVKACASSEAAQW